jgi:hypothetical protein
VVATGLKPAAPGNPLAAIIDGLGEATDMIESVLRTHLPRTDE